LGSEGTEARGKGGKGRGAKPNGWDANGLNVNQLNLANQLQVGLLGPRTPANGTSPMTPITPAKEEGLGEMDLSQHGMAELLQTGLLGSSCGLGGLEEDASTIDTIVTDSFFSGGFKTDDLEAELDLAGADAAHFGRAVAQELARQNSAEDLRGMDEGMGEGGEGAAKEMAAGDGDGLNFQELLGSLDDPGQNSEMGFWDELGVGELMPERSDGISSDALMGDDSTLDWLDLGDDALRVPMMGEKEGGKRGRSKVQKTGEQSAGKKEGASAFQMWHTPQNLVVGASNSAPKDPNAPALAKQTSNPQRKRPSIDEKPWMGPATTQGQRLGSKGNISWANVTTLGNTPIG